MTAPKQVAIGCGPNGAEPVRIPEMPPTLYADLLAVVAGRRDQSDEAVAKSLVTVIKLHAIADQDWEAEAKRLRDQLEAESVYQGMLRDERDHLTGQVQRVRDVIAWARTHDEELLANRDRLSSDQRAQRKAWEWSAYEVRGLADRLSTALSVQGRQAPTQIAAPGGIAIVPGRVYRDGTPACEAGGPHARDCDLDCADQNRWLAVQCPEGVRLISLHQQGLFAPDEVAERFKGLTLEQQDGGQPHG